MPKVTSKNTEKPKPKKKPSQAKRGSGKKIEEASNGREIIYPTYSMQLCTIDSERAEGSSPLMYDMAVKLLGWQRPKEGETFENYLFKDDDGITIVCSNNDQNRPFSMSHAKAWMKEILAGNWELNGETLIIGETGMCLDCQHRLIGFVLAVEEWRRNGAAYPKWEYEPQLDCIIFFGTRETRRVVNTINTGKSRSLADAIYASGIFIGATKKDIKVLSRMTDYCIRLLWERTNANSRDPAKRRTHADSLEFLERHPAILDRVQVLYDGGVEDVKNFISPGYAAALFYLMSVSDSEPTRKDGTGYYQLDYPNEDALSFEMQVMAEKFWDLLSAGDDMFEPIRKSIANMDDGGSVSKRIALLVKAWESYRTTGTITDKDIKLKYTTVDDGYKVLAEYPTIGGIDIEIEV